MFAFGDRINHCGLFVKNYFESSQKTHCNIIQIVYNKIMLNAKTINQKRLALAIGTHPVYLNAILRGRRRPSPDLALRIEEATGGAVTRMELLYPEEKEL